MLKLISEVTVCFYPLLDIEELWNESEEVMEDMEPEAIAPIFSNSGEHHQASSLVKWVIAFIAFVQATYKLSDMLAEVWIKFLKILFRVLGTFSSLCLDIANGLPDSLYILRKITGGLSVGFVRYVVCKKCHHIYHVSECVDARSKRCSFKSFPHHSQARMRQSCDTLLLKTVELASGKVIQYPFMTYCYMSLESSMGNLLQRPGIYQLSEHWRNRSVVDDKFRDVYDGKMWKDFINYRGVPFLSEPLTFGLMINMDWFQPYKHVQYSVGAIYITVLNLPRHVRNKTNNVILVGLMPGPNECPGNVNS